ncbi:N(4)-(beta-N-acetylglucosaminyl)-L-asparaginase [Verticillium dahliae VDG1]|nr:N(4)-(beta-N-acetylglucosaminyl)-L-asparaginase [Verticillium dahliae VDG1]
MSALGNELDFFPPYDPPPSIQPEQQQEDPLDPVTMHKTAPFPGFTALSEQVFVREAPVSDGPRPAGQPHTVMLYGWGDGTARNVQKYTDGYAALFPHARQIAVLSPIAKAMFNSAAARAVAMTPVEDDLITSDDVEMYMAESRQKGYQLRAELFDGSGHVGHMRMHPEKYWKAIADAWAWANEEPKRG